MPRRRQYTTAVEGRLVVWSTGEARAEAQRLKAAGFDVRADLPHGPTFVKELASAPPDALVIDLGRLPSQGRDLAILVRRRAATRHIALVFVGGARPKVERMRELLPDATYTSWEQIGDALTTAIATAPPDPVVPASAFAAYGKADLATKLGVRPGLPVRLVNAPAGFPDRLAASCRGSDVTQQAVRGAGLAQGLVDYKIASLDGGRAVRAQLGWGHDRLEHPHEDLGVVKLVERPLAAGLGACHCQKGRHRIPQQRTWPRPGPSRAASSPGRGPRRGARRRERWSLDV
jgi:hypothetical protein